MISGVYLDAHPDHIFVFGDNKLRRGKKGAAVLRDYPNSYGFITKKIPSNDKGSFYKCREYEPVFHKELAKLEKLIQENPDKTYLISKLGAGLANKHKIWENIIERGLDVLAQYPNVKYLYK